MFADDNWSITCKIKPKNITTCIFDFRKPGSGQDKDSVKSKQEIQMVT